MQSYPGDPAGASPDGALVLAAVMASLRVIAPSTAIVSPAELTVIVTATLHGADTTRAKLTSSRRTPDLGTIFAAGWRATPLCHIFFMWFVPLTIPQGLRAVARS
jgi:hypothetical protein